MLIPSDKPAYRILAPAGFFGPDDHLYHEGDCIVFLDEPNEEMEPLNDLARQRMRAYLEKLDNEARKVAEKNGRSFTGRARNLEEAVAQASADARRVQLISGDGGVPLMGAKRDVTEVIGKIEETDTPETGRRGPGRPKRGEGTLSLAQAAARQ